jgi:hypothetical protein
MIDHPILHVELCIANDLTLQKETARNIIKRGLADWVEVWPYATAESFAPVKVITPTATGEIADVQTATIAALFSKGWLEKEIKHAIKNQTLPPGSTPILIKTKHQHAHTLLVSPLQWEAAPHEDISQTKNVFYATKAAIQEAQRLGFHRIALPVTDARNIGQMLDAI